MKSIRELLSTRFQKKDSEEIDEKAVERVLYDILKKEFPDLCQTDIKSFKIKDGKIFLRTVHPAIAAEIWRKKETIKKRINIHLESETIKEIRTK